MDKLTKDEVLHVASLGKLKLSEEEVDKFSYELKLLFDEINKINELKLDAKEGMISPSNNKCAMFNDEVIVFSKPSSLIENAPSRFENFIEVAGVFDE